jgi:hypothetical protein
MFLQKNIDISNKQFRVNFAEINIDQATKRKNDAAFIDDQPVQKKLKQQDYLINQPNNDDYVINIENEDDE